VPEEKIRTRYYKALTLLPEIIGVCDKMLIYDNSDKPSLIFCKADSKEEIFPNYIWSELAILKLLNK
jgi:predicted ABC-type ATPase